MTKRHIETLTCDRCGNAFLQHNGTGECFTTSIGWLIYNKGGGSWYSHQDSEVVIENDNLDKDFCELCTEEFKAFIAGRLVPARSFPEEERVHPEDLLKQQRVLREIKKHQKQRNTDLWPSTH